MHSAKNLQVDHRAVLELARHTILTEGQAILALADYVDNDFAKTVDLLIHTPGRAVITGIGKSANIAQKIVATLNSTGTPAIFMHAADAIHGDLGIVQPGDVVICISKSGTTPEVKVLVPLIKMLGNTLVAIVSNVDSYLAQQADLVLKATVQQEACPNNLAPTSSTTAQLVIGDALAVTLLKARGFTPEDFGKYHPGGSLGRRLYLRVENVLDPALRPAVRPEDGIAKVILEISSNRMGATAVLDGEGNLRGIITDGDLRRLLQRTQAVESTRAQDFMTPSPCTVERDELAINAFKSMEDRKINQLIVLHDGQYVGMVHIHDLLREGIIG